jgi:hypothetical protein
VGKRIRALRGLWGGKEGCFEFCYYFCFFNIGGLTVGRICLGMGFCVLGFRFYFVLSQYLRWVFHSLRAVGELSH